MEGFKFDTKELEKLNDPERLKDIPLEYLWEKIEEKHPETVVDLGAGTGFFSVRFAGMPNVKKVYSLDIADVMVEYMKMKVVPEHGSIKPLKMEESEVPLEDHVADILVMINLHHELHEPVKLLQECSRVLKPGGKLAIVDWKKKETEHGPPVEKRYDTEPILNQLRKVPFRSVKVYDDLPNHFLIVARRNDGTM